jgi:hypothetical protein
MFPESQTAAWIASSLHSSQWRGFSRLAVALA